MGGFTIKYGQAWETSDEMIPGRSAVYVPPVTLPPVLTAVTVRLIVERRKATRANPLGSVKAITWLWPQSALDARGGAAPDEPPGAKALIKVLASAPSAPEIIVSYARGYDVNASGENVRRPIWEEHPVDPTDEDAGKKRVKVGEEEPVPVDSIVVAGVWRDLAGNITTFVEGWWVNAAPQRGRTWQTGGHMAYLGWTPFMEKAKEIADGEGTLL